MALKSEQVRSGFHYYEAYPQEIDQAIEENDLGYDRLKAMPPNLQLATVPLAVQSEVGR
jgi:hypothetical protein